MEHRRGSGPGGCQPPLAPHARTPPPPCPGPTAAGVGAALKKLKGASRGERGARRHRGLRFDNGLADGQSIWFSLEGSPSQITLSQTIAIDPGHGTDCQSLFGTSDGTAGPTYGDTEAALALRIANQMASIARSHQYHVLLTRTSDGCQSIQNRWRLANEEKVNAFVSIHFNATGSPGVDGTEVWYYPPKTDSQDLASDLLQEIVGSLPLANRGLKRSGTDAPWAGKNIGVLVGTKMTAALVEVAFLTNPSDEELMHQASSQNAAANACFVGVDNFFNQ